MNIEKDEIISLFQEYENLKDNVKQNGTLFEFAILNELIKIRKLLEVDKAKSVSSNSVSFGEDVIEAKKPSTKSK